MTPPSLYSRFGLIMSIDLPDDLVPRSRPGKRRKLTGHDAKVARRRVGLPKLVCLHEVLEDKLKGAGVAEKGDGVKGFSRKPPGLLMPNGPRGAS